MAEVGIFVGTMYGNSLLVAEEAEAILVNGAIKQRSMKIRSWRTGKSIKINTSRVVTSTTGQGDSPDSIVPLFQALKTSLAISQMFTMASLPSAIALTPISAAAVNSSTRCCRNRALSASERCC